MNALQSYQDDIKAIQDQFRAEMNLYRSQADLYTAQMKEYQTAKISYDATRRAAVSSAEALIKVNIDKIGWTFVDIRDMKSLIPWIIKTWTAQLIIIGVYFLVILVFIKHKDASA
jgi:multidrug efflux pump subunit AcrA (membrane-fusion protein)